MTAPAGERVTVAELGRRMTRLEEDTKSGFAGLHRRLDDFSFVDRETLDTKLMVEQALRAELERRISHLEADNDRREADEKNRERQRDEDRKVNRRLAITSIVSPLLVLVLGALILAAMGMNG